MTSRSARAAMAIIYRHISPRRRVQLYFLLALLLFGATAELVAIAAVVPFLTLLTGSEALDRFSVVRDLFDVVGATGPRARLIAATVLFATAAVLTAFVRTALAWTTHSFSFGLGHDLSMAVQSRLLYQPYAFHASVNSSELVAAQEKIFSLIYVVVLPTITGLTAAMTSLFIVGILFYIDAVVATVAVVSIGAIYLVVTYFTRQRLHHYGAVTNSAHSHRVQAVQESLGGIRDILIDQSQAVYLSHYERLGLKLKRAMIAGAFISAAPRFVVEATGMVLIAALAFVLSSKSGGFTSALPVLGALALSAQRLLPLLQQVYYGWAQVRQGTPLAATIAKLLELEILPERIAADKIEPLPFDKEIRFELVSFRYPNRDELSLCDIDLIIPKGSKVALIGRTGSGKSTFVDILMGLLEPTSGCVTIDGVRPVGRKLLAWQTQIAHVPQAIFLADTTIDRNIAFGVAAEDIDAERVLAAAKAAQIHHFIEELPNGYQTFVGERGIRLSGGQRQRLGIARALYKRTNILVLDEATSALDSDTERAIIAALSENQEAVTIVMIAHRLSSVANCDIVVRLEAGRIVHTGSHAEVIGEHGQEI